MTLEKAGWQGLYIPELSISLDGAHPDAETTFVSHAHADHMHRNRKANTIATAPTLELMQLRGYNGTGTPLAFGEPIETNRFRATLFPAGHILGSAMVYIESDRGTLLYTGDYRTPPSPATEGFDAPAQADCIITEATFGLPIYRWRSHDELTQELHTFVQETLDDGYTPVLLAYNLGKAQELMTMLAPLGLPVMIHGAGYNLCSVYEAYNIDLGSYQPYERERCEGHILIAPSSALANGFASNVSKKRIAYCSGWAALESRRSQLTVDKLLPLSDHLDFYELIDFCERLSPKEVLVTHTPNPDVVCHYLKQRGIAGRHLNLEKEADDG
ncbi:MAG: hypothetical protein ACNA78_09625 [Balneolaceae bacterium]